MIGKLLKALVKLGFIFLLVVVAIVMFFIWLIKGGITYFKEATGPIPNYETVDSSLFVIKDFSNTPGENNRTYRINDYDN